MSDNDSINWYFGNMFMNEYYTVFDMTPYNERGENFLQIGFAKQSKKDIVFEKSGGDKYNAEYGVDDDEVEGGATEGDDKSSGGGAGTVFLVLFLLGLFFSLMWYVFKGFPCIRNGETGSEFLQSLKNKEVVEGDYDQLQADESVEKNTGKRNSALEALENI